MRLRAILILATMVLGGLLLSWGAPALADIVGDGRDNTLNGNNKKNVIRGKGGKDTLDGKENRDWLYGGDGNDTLYGGRGDDILYGGPGEDIVNGNQGSDYISGGPDELNGDNGNDTLVAVDNEEDIINCGPGNDRAWVDQTDELEPPQTNGDCEQVVRCPDGQPENCPGGQQPPKPPPPPAPDRDRSAYR
jgi:Ca2+-binding RTX toxin-like protein